jgi:hypothetical protein
MALFRASRHPDRAEATGKSGQALAPGRGDAARDEP